MKRSHINRTSELSRFTRLRRAALTRTETPPKPRRKQTGPTVAVRALVNVRDASCCVVCGLRGGPHVWPAHAQHHRRPRAAGGTRREDANSPASLVTLCAGDHARVESDRAWALRVGLLVHQAADPAGVPLTYRGRLSRLNDDGTVEEV